MNRLRLIKTAYTALACLMLAACASDELTDGTVQDLPEGKYPLQISSITMSAESTAEPCVGKHERQQQRMERR